MRIRAALPPALAILMSIPPLAAADSLDDVVRIVRDAARQHAGDADLARALHQLALNRRMDNRTAEELESLAAGPKSIAELEALREASRGKPLPKVLPEFASPPEPAEDELADVLAGARHQAIAYTASLPDFICTETVRRYTESAWRGWELQDSLTLQLTYFEHVEKYKLTARNGRQTDLTYDDVGGAVSRGEFGSMLLAVFAPASQAGFRWSNWTTLRRRAAYVLSFRIDVSHSRYTLTAGRSGVHPITAKVGEHGLVYIDRETRDVVRLASEAVSVPKNLLVAAASSVLDYGPVEVGGHTYLLPLRADVHMTPRENYPPTRNEVDFTSYRKFAGESEISFGDPVDEKTAPPQGKAP